LEHLRDLALWRKAVVVPKSPAFCKCKPAAFLIGLPGRVLQRLFDIGMFVYEKPKEKDVD